MKKETEQYPWVICIDGEPLIEKDGSLTLYHDHDDDAEVLRERFKTIVSSSEDPSRVTIKRLDSTTYLHRLFLSTNLEKTLNKRKERDNNEKSQS